MTPVPVQSVTIRMDDLERSVTPSTHDRDRSGSCNAMQNMHLQNIRSFGTPIVPAIARELYHVGAHAVSRSLSASAEEDWQ
jgi:hypothetical protein